MNPLKAIGFKLISALLFAGMSALVRQLGDVAPVGQMVFFRSAFAIVPVVVIYAFRGELASAVRTSRPLGQLGRGTLSVCGMFTNFSALTRLPLADATAISFASPLITVALAALVLKERVRIYRWSAVIAGFVGVIVMLIPHFDLSHYAVAGVASVAAIGSAFALTSAICNAGTVIQTRRLTQNETTSSIVFYFSLICAIVGVADVAIRVAFSDFVRADRADCTRISRRSRAYFSYRELSLCGCIGRGALRLIVDVMGIAAWLLAIRRIARKTGLSGRGHCHRRRAFRDLA
ncbi:MAG: DMT family transporter [Pseudolabrys sp.]|jgi:drug/metabolite transporter (DMT)-like permease